MAAHGPSWALAGFSVCTPVARSISKRLYRHTSQSVCPWNVKFSQALAEDSPLGGHPNPATSGHLKTGHHG